MTKLHEEFLRGPLSHIISELDQRKTVKGECTLLVSGAAPATAAAPQDIDVAIDAFLSDQDRPLSDIARELATKLNVSRKQVYERALEIKKLKE
jgi:16S rRNA (cytidine1402-2'-O)-methyltransferase